MGDTFVYLSCVTTEVGASLCLPHCASARLAPGRPERRAMSTDSPATKAMTSAVVDSAQKLEGAASLLRMLEDKAEREGVTSAELAAVRCTVESCAAALDASWQNI